MMTPGYAKPRAELPWLPYPESDKVFVINAHNFGGGAFSPAVNGKMPIAAWIPSRDDAGNGTTTLTDLVGSSNGTLTNMDAATDWVADTGAGGVRALDFDGSNDHVRIAGFSGPSSTITISVWVKTADVSGSQRVFLQGGISVDQYLRMQQISGQYQARFGSGSWNPGEVLSASLSSNWVHLVAYHSNSGRRGIYRNGTLAEDEAVTGSIASSPGLILGAYFGGSFGFSGRLDDIRIFDQSLDATDVADLYASGNGRGVDAS